MDCVCAGLHRAAIDKPLTIRARISFQARLVVLALSREQRADVLGSAGSLGPARSLATTRWQRRGLFSAQFLSQPCTLPRHDDNQPWQRCPAARIPASPFLED